MDRADSSASRAEGAPAGRETVRDGRSAARAAEASALRTVAAHVDALDGDRWQIAALGSETLLDAVGPDNSRVTILTFTAHAKPEEIELVAGALDHARMLLGVITRAKKALRAADGEGGQPLPRPSDTAQPAPRAKKNHAAEAAMLCERAAFRNWLIERHGLDLKGTADDAARTARAAQKLRSLLGVTSRKAINEDDAVRDRWIALRQDYYATAVRGQG